MLFSLTNAGSASTVVFQVGQPRFFGFAHPLFGIVVSLKNYAFVLAIVFLTKEVSSPLKSSAFSSTSANSRKSFRDGGIENDVGPAIENVEPTMRNSKLVSGKGERGCPVFGRWCPSGSAQHGRADFHLDFLLPW
jgi:hypothetical protein